MRTSALVLVLSVLPLASLASAAGLAQEPARADNTLGSWKLDVARSSYVGASLPTRSLVMTREQTPEGVRVTITGERADGRPLQVTYVAPYDGKPHPAAGNGPFDTIAVTRIDANTLLDERWKSGGSFRATVRTTVAPDGRTLTTVAHGTLATGAPFTSTLVHVRQ